MTCENNPFGKDFQPNQKKNQTDFQKVQSNKFIK